ncbi:three component ABC system middle component [Arcticibacter tournemirensis]
MKIDNVFDIYQNCSLSALLLYEFVVTYEKINKEKASPALHHVLPVLPILFTKELIQSAKGRSNNVKGFYNILEDNRVLFELIPGKANSMLEKTLFSLSICHQSNLIDFDFEKNLVMSSLSAPRQKYTAPTLEIGDMIRISRKLGGWFANLTDIEFFMYLKLEL